MDFDIITIYPHIILALLFLLFIIYFVVQSTFSKMPHVVRYEDEKFYLDLSTQPPTKKLFPSLHDEFSVFLSIIVPAYNEESRLPIMMDECLDYLENRSKKDSDFSYEVIVVDDGSSDATTKVALKYANDYGSEKIRVLTLVKNRGKGGAVRLGMLSARGKFLLFADADGATKFIDIEKLETEMTLSSAANTNSVVIGSRAHLEKEAIASRTFYRTILMYGFHFLVWFFGVRTVRDTQCGFKMFTREAARSLFSVLHVERWAFDVELLYIAEKTKMSITEVSVNWTEIEGSKLVPVWSWVQMGIDLVLIWIKYQLNIWNVRDLKKES